MKKQKIKGVLLGAAVLTLCSGLFTLSYGAVKLGVRYTKHNLGSTAVAGSQFHATTESEVCVFCHTPHNSAAGQRFLWNRVPDANSATVFQRYSSRTLSSAAKGAVISPVSKMCMSCHDGVTALNSMANGRGVGVGGPIGAGDALSTSVWFGQDLGSGPMWGPNIGNGDVILSPGGASGGNLKNDHPISFDYTAAQAANSGLKVISVPKSQGLVFWAAPPPSTDPTENQIECVTCHDPHINYNASYGGDPALKKFLRRSNASSNLCFACHDK